MDTERLQKIFEHYAEKYENVINSERRETAKWSAVSRFQKFWDLDSANFGEMFKTALEEAEGMVGEAAYQPVNGIAFLCRQGTDTMEEVRDAFRELFTPDGSDYALRQKKAEDFVGRINGILKETAPDKWKYHQEISAAILYLAFADPDDNYIYKEAEVKAFCEYLDVTDEIFSGDRLDLAAYYRMCDEVLNELNQQTDLLQMVGDALSEEADETDDSSVTEIDGDNHILVFDIIYCAQNYDLYENERGRKSKAALASEEEEQAKVRLERELAELERKQKTMADRLAEIAYPDIAGAAVSHKRYGSGHVSAQSGRQFSVDFGTGEKKFMLPDAFAKGFLSTEDEGLVSVCREILQLTKSGEALQCEIDLLRHQISTLG
jgi:hypothetical protein